MTATNNITKAIIMYGNMSGYVLWRNNNGAVYSLKRQHFMKNPAHKLGIPDIIGYRKSDGKAVYIEVKTGKDKLSLHQEDFICQAQKSGCIAIVTKNADDALKILTGK